MENCAVTYHTGFWSTDCFAANPNEPYSDDVVIDLAVGIVRHTFKSLYEGLMSMELKVKPK